MTLQNIDTFEQDIAQELKKKEVNIRTIATASGDVNNNQPPSEVKKSPLPIILSIIFLLLAGGGGIFGYMYYNQMISPVQDVPQPQLPIVKTTRDLLKEIAPAFPDAIGLFVTSVTKSADGYILRISSFSPVYAYMLKNEDAYANDLAKSLGVPQAIKSDIPLPPAVPVAVTTVATPTPATSTSATTTKTTNTATKPIQGTTTKTTPQSAATTSTTTTTQSTTTAPAPIETVDQATVTPAEKDTTPVPFIFSDITMTNQNMRVGMSGKNTIYYAFIENKALVFSKTPEGILTLKNAILR